MGHYYLGIDIGGTTIRGVAMRNFADKKPQRAKCDTPKNEKDFFAALEKLVVSLAGDKKLSGIGVGLAGIVDAKRGILLMAPHLPFLVNWNAREYFKKFGVPVRIENDVNCFVLAEHELGAAKRYTNVVGIAIGTGIGAGIIIDGRLYRGSHGSAGEVGHTILQVARLRSLPVQSFEELGAKEAFEKWGDRSEIIGIGVANLINSFDPDIVVLGGGGVTSGGVKIPAVKKAAKQWVLSPLSKKTPVVKGSLGEYAQAMGAALLFAESACLFPLAH